MRSRISSGLRAGSMRGMDDGDAITAAARISRASASIDRPWLAACIRNFCLIGSAKFRIVKVVLIPDL